MTYGYDASGHKTSETGPQGTTSYAYDSNNRITQITYPNTGVHNYSYDGQGRVSSEDDGMRQVFCPLGMWVVRRWLV